jgi:hypothetical protein
VRSGPLSQARRHKSTEEDCGHDDHDCDEFHLSLGSARSDLQRTLIGGPLKRTHDNRAVHTGNSDPQCRPIVRDHGRDDRIVTESVEVLSFLWTRNADGDGDDLHQVITPRSGGCPAKRRRRSRWRAQAATGSCWPATHVRGCRLDACWIAPSHVGHGLISAGIMILAEVAIRVGRSLADLAWQGQAVQRIGREAGEEGHRAD